MSTTELITPVHLARKAIIYIRQSTPHQVLSNQESLRLQYALKQRALDLGWQLPDIEIIDTDLGLRGASAEHREGFQELVAKVTLGQVGLILSFDVTRLSRNCSDWYPLLDVCGYRHCLIGDHHNVYDPSTPDGRLLLGLKGQLSELELHTIRARMTAGLLNKAKRGELALYLPVGLVRNSLGQVVKNPNREVQQRLELVFDTFLRLKTASKVVRHLNEQSLPIPRRDRFGDVIWKRPTVAAILDILKNPAYAGAFVYGRTRTIRDVTGKARQKRLPIDQWRIRVNDKYPPYVSWETYKKIQVMIQDNYAEYERNKSRGIPRPGAALLHGLVYCGKCGHKMLVQYKGGNQYLCNALRQQYQVPVCQRVPADPIDEQVVDAFFQALSPMELDAFERALAIEKEAEGKINQAHQQQLERLRYQTALAERQFNQVDPDNRLVAAELEKRWEAALRELKQAEETYAREKQKRTKPIVLPPEVREAFTAIGQKLPQIWQQDVLTREQRKALLRCLIDKVVIHRAVPDRVQTRIVWRGGDTTALDIPVPVGSFADLSDAAEMEEVILDLSRKGQTDAEIADHLTGLGYRSPMRTDVVLPSTVMNIRLKHGIFLVRSQSHPRQIPGYLTLPQVARLLDVKPHFLYDHIKRKRIQVTKDEHTGLYLFPDTPDTITAFQQFKEGKIKNLHFSRGHQDV
ncbi:MAG: recombinase family protein [Anaerolineaceae bacterium]|nr:MAG: recombinase family protein [Anaerolineaceae bacterium]